MPSSPLYLAAQGRTIIMSSKFFTNHGEQTLLAKFRGVFASNPDIEHFDALVGYLRASGYFAIRPFLEQVPHIRILVGINVDAIVADYQRRGLLYLADPTRALDDFQASLHKDIQSAPYSPEVESGVRQLVQDVATRKVEIRAHPDKKLHAKVYVFRPKGFNEHKPGAVITGSSNLTAAGLGAHDIQRNYEFNVLLHDYDDVVFSAAEFDRLWEESTSVLPKLVQGVLQRSYLGVDLVPRDLYYKLLLEYFGAAVDFDPNAIGDLPEGFLRLTYQTDAVSQGFRLLERHRGFFLADVVGLGKTVIATLIAKKFFFYNGFPEHRSHTLIVVPPALEDSWQSTLDLFRLDNVRIITNGSLHKLRKPERYDLVIVDEAHKFRNDTAEAFDELQRICKTPTQRVMPDGTRREKRVILVSATPLNNRPEDIRNQLALFQDLKDSTLSVSNLQHFFAQRERMYRQAKKEPTVERARQMVKAIYEDIRTKVISEVIVRRTRADLKEHEQYSKDLEEQGVVFPAVQQPRAVLFELPPALDALYDRTVTLLSRTDAEGLTYNRYRAIAYLKEDRKRQYQNADRIAQQLATIMRTLLIKRIDSSFHAFRLSLNRFRQATEIMLGMFNAGTIYIAPNLRVTEFLVEDREDELIAKIEERQPTDPTIAICQPSDFEEGFVDGLRRDAQKLKDLCDAWEAVTDDPKLETFRRVLSQELFSRDVNYGGKLVIFSEARDTTEYLRDQLADSGHRILTVDSGNRKDRMPLVRANFDANAKEKADDYDVLISTEVLAEGVNLHRSNVIVNYDTPWNSTRLMQRIGRVNRIGTTAPRLFIYNFHPTSQVDDDIELRKKAIMKLQAFHTALGEDSQIYSDTEEVDNFGLFERIPEDEDRDERLALLMELRRFRADRPEEFRRIAQLPLRCRIGRADTGRSGATVAFIRSQRRDAFFRLRADGERDELSIVEAAREFRVLDPREKPADLPDFHYAHVTGAVQAFREKAVAEALQDQTVTAAQGPNERRALAYLDGFTLLPFVSEQEKRLLAGAKRAIHKARFQQLQRQINQLQRSTKQVKVAPVALLEKLMEILREYPLLDDDKDAPPTAAVARQETALPDIIISESFTSA